MTPRITVGAQVSWVDALGDTRFGSVTAIDDDGRVHVASAQTNARGKKVTRIANVWFDANEVGRLKVRP